VCQPGEENDKIIYVPLSKLSFSRLSLFPLPLVPSFPQINPAKEVPTLVIDGHTLRQSLAIIEYVP
jgi:glutathione S-transferase